MDVQIIPRIDQESYSCSIDDHRENSFATAQISRSRKWMTFDISLNGNVIKSFSTMEEAINFHRKLVIASTRIVFPGRNTNTHIF